MKSKLPPQSRVFITLCYVSYGDAGETKRYWGSCGYGSATNVRNDEMICVCWKVRKGQGGAGKKGGVFLEGVGVERERVPQAGSDGGNSAYDDEREGIYKMSSCMWPTARYE